MAEAGKNGPLRIQTGSDDAMDLGKRFQNVRPLGYGAGGLVYSASDTKYMRNVSVKKIVLHNQRSWRQALREIKILKKLKHENIVTLHDVLDELGAELKLATQSSLGNVKSLVFIQELMDTNLKYLIDSRQLTPAHVRLLMYQLLRGLKYLHSANVLHRDLKPANLFVNCDTVLLKIGDFGTSRIVDPEYSHAGHLTASVGTCWCRSPESILTPQNYTTATDIWSAGCIMAHCLLGAPLFQGIHELDQVRHIIDSVELLDSDWSKVLRVMPNKLLKNHPFRPRTPLHTKLLGIESTAQALLEAMLTFDAGQRITAEEALSHPYFHVYSSLNNEPIMDTPFRIEHEVDDLPVPRLQSLLVSESSQVLKESADCTNLCDTLSLSTSPVNAEVSVNDDSSSDMDSSQKDYTHTLEEIFQAPYHSPPCYTTPRYTTVSYPTAVTQSQGSSSQSLVESKNARNKESGVARMDLENKKNTVNSMRQTGQDVNAGEDLVLSEGGTKMSGRDEGSKRDEDEEKDVAECSPSKLQEDLELGINQMINRAQALALNVEHLEQINSAKLNENQQTSEQTLIVEVQDTENLKEFSQASPKGLSPSASAYNIRLVGEEPRQQADPQHAQPQRNRGAMGSIRNSGWPGTDINKEQYYRKQRLKEETRSTISRKLILDKFESEKEAHRSSLSSEEFDELYRLPTDHLAINRDLSNQRLKHQTLMARNPLQHSHYRCNRRRKHDLSERLNEDKFYHVEGACGGDEHSPEISDHSETDDIIQNILYDSVNSGLIQPHSFSNQVNPGFDIDISLDVLPTGHVVPTPASRDPLSSPESPPSPNGGRSGARPKKSPKKQRAL